MTHNAQSADLWDTIASKYDTLRPDQGLTNPDVRTAWQVLLAQVLPTQSATILDVGCGTGSLTLLLEQMGHQASGLDFSPQMIEEAIKKANTLNLSASFTVGDGTKPDFKDKTFDAIVSRQVLWALPNRKNALANWADLLKPGGILILVEGVFASGNGMSSNEIIAAMPNTMTNINVTDLGPQTDLWGGPISDQRYLLTAHRE